MLGPLAPSNPIAVECLKLVQSACRWFGSLVVIPRKEHLRRVFQLRPVVLNSKAGGTSLPPNNFRPMMGQSLGPRKVQNSLAESLEHFNLLWSTYPSCLHFSTCVAWPILNAPFWRLSLQVNFKHLPSTAKQHSKSPRFASTDLRPSSRYKHRDSRMRLLGGWGYHFWPLIAELFGVTSAVMRIVFKWNLGFHRNWLASRRDDLGRLRKAWWVLFVSIKQRLTVG